jgi:hypothetical protein
MTKRAGSGSGPLTICLVPRSKFFYTRREQHFFCDSKYLGFESNLDLATLLAAATSYDDCTVNPLGGLVFYEKSFFYFTNYEPAKS